MSSPPDRSPAEPARHDAGWGELIVLNGSLTGTRWPLQTPSVVLGRKEGSDYRIDDADVSPVHAVLLRTPDGAVLRDLYSDGGSFVNGESVAEATLHEGDLIAIGSCQFEFHRIAVTDEETTLEERRQALTQQRSQLDAQFAARQRQLVRLRNDAHAATEALRTERKSYKKYVGQAVISMDRARTEIAADREQAIAERWRLLRVHQQLKKRTERRCLAERAALEDRARQLDACRADLARTAQTLLRDKEALFHVRVRHNGETELARRQLQAGWNELRDTERQWEAARIRQQAELDLTARRLVSQRVELEAHQRDLASERRQWCDRLRDLQAEAEGLENRIGHLRHKLHAQEDELNRLAAARERAHKPAAPTVALAPQSASVVQETYCFDRTAHTENIAVRLRALEALTVELELQRQQQSEQALQLYEARLRWREEQLAIVAQLEELAKQADERERQLQAQEVVVERIQREQQQRSHDLEQRANHLEARRSQADVRRAEFEFERERMHAKVKSPPPNCTGESLSPHQQHQLQWQLLCMHAQRNSYERHIRALNEEVERLACALIDDEPAILALPAALAA